MNENWFDIKDFEGFYQISDKGRVRSVDRFVNNTLKSTRFLKGQIIKPTKKKEGYLSVRLAKDNSKKTFYVHRLVMTNIVPLEIGKDFVNHINGIKDDNRVENLEWCTRSENSRHNFDVLKQKGVRRKLNKDQVLFIRKNHKKGFGGNTKELSKKFNVCENVILHVVNKKYYEEII